MTYWARHERAALSIHPHLAAERAPRRRHPRRLLARHPDLLPAGQVRPVARHLRGPRSRPRSASRSTRWNTTAHTLLFDLEDGCRQKEMSRELLRRELPQPAAQEGSADRGAHQPVPHRGIREGPEAGARPGRPLRRGDARQGGRSLRRARDPRSLRGARGPEPPDHHPAHHRAPQVAQDRARPDAVLDGEARGVRHPRFLQGDGHPDHAAKLDRGAQVLPAPDPVRGAHRRQGRDRRRGNADRPRRRCRRTLSSPTTCAAGSTCTATRNRASSTSMPARKRRWA